MLKELKIEELVPHPLNRKFKTEGMEWDDFVASVAEHGVIERLFVRKVKKGYEVLAGHRRMAAARECGLMLLPCQVLDLDEIGALVFLINSNLQRENPNVVQEAELVRELMNLGMDESGLCRSLSRDGEWLRVRQMVFEFDGDVVDALERGVLSEGALREVLYAPEPLRERALEVVMGGGEAFDEPLSAERAREFIQFSLIPDWEKEQEWEAGMEKTRKAVLREMRKLADGAENEVTVLVLPWGKGVEGLGGELVPARDVVPLELVHPDVSERRAWAWYAAQCGAPIYVVPPDKLNHEKRALVSRKILLDDAAARLENGMPCELLPKARAVKDPKVVAAVQVLDGEGEADYDPNEPTSPVATSGEKDGLKIEQTMEHHAMIDMGAVKRLAMWAVSADADPAKAPEYVPRWAVELAYEGQWKQIDAVVNWVKGLGKKG